MFYFQLLSFHRNQTLLILQRETIDLKAFRFAICTQFLFEKKLQLNYFWVISLEQINYFLIDLCVDLASPCAHLRTWHIVALRKLFLRHHIGSFGRCCIRWTVFGRGSICIGRWCAFRTGCIIVMLLGHFRFGKIESLWKHFQHKK